MLRREDVFPVPRCAESHCTRTEVHEALKDAFTVLGRRRHSLDGGGEVMEHSVAVRQLVSVCPHEYEAACGRLLVGCANRTLGHGPGDPVAWIKRVVGVAVEVREAAFVELRGVRGAEDVIQGALLFRGPRVPRNGIGREVVCGVAAHFV